MNKRLTVQAADLPKIQPKIRPGSRSTRWLISQNLRLCDVKENQLDSRASGELGPMHTQLSGFICSLVLPLSH